MGMTVARGRPLGYSGEGTKSVNLQALERDQGAGPSQVHGRTGSMEQETSWLWKGRGRRDWELRVS